MAAAGDDEQMSTRARWPTTCTANESWQMLGLRPRTVHGSSSRSLTRCVGNLKLFVARSRMLCVRIDHSGLSVGEGRVGCAALRTPHPPRATEPDRPRKSTF